MTYTAIDKSKDSGAPDELYKFVVENRTFYYTDAVRPALFDGVRYSPKQIVRSALTHNSSFLDTSQLTISIPVTDELARLVGTFVTPTDFTVEIWQRHRTDPDSEAKRYAFGFVQEVAQQDKELTLAVSSFLNSHISTNVVTVGYGPICPHEWGGPRCGVDKELYSVTSAVIGADYWTLTVADFAGADMTQYLGGYLVNLRTGVRRNIVDISGNVVYIPCAFIDLQLGDEIRLYQGCNHLIGASGNCFTKFNNTENHGGFPLVPETNPFILTFGDYDYSSFTGTEDESGSGGGEILE